MICKFCLWSIQNHARHHFQAIVHRHLKLPCCLIGIWAHALFSDRSAALHRIHFGTCRFASVPSSYPQINEWLKDWAKQWAQIWSVTSSSKNPLKFYFTCQKNVLDWVTAQHLQSIKPFFFTLELNEFASVVACFPQAFWSRPSATAPDSETSSVCARQSYLSKLCWRLAPRAWPLILQSRTLILAFWSDCQMICTVGAQTWTHTWTPPSDQLIVKVLSAPKSQNKLCEVWIFCRCVENAEIEDRDVLSKLAMA